MQTHRQQTRRDWCRTATRVAFLVVCCVGSRADAGCNKNDDGSAAVELTAKTLYNQAKATCIPKKAFEGYTGILTLGDMPLLERIDDQAFGGLSSFGRLNINAQNLRSLRYIGGLIFGTGSKSRLNPNGKEHVVKLGNMPLLEDISDGALFQQFPGTLVIDAGDVPKLKGIGTPTVVVPITTTYLPTDASSIAFGAMPAIEQIGQNAFNSFPGTLTINAGDTPLLKMVGKEAFRNAGNAESSVAFSNLVALAEIEEQKSSLEKIKDELPFLDFKGAAKLTGPFSSWTGAKSGSFFRGSCVNLGVPGTTVYKVGQVPLTMAAFKAATLLKDDDSSDPGTVAKELAKYTCIPSFEFMSFSEDLALWPMPLLQTIGMMAFRSFAGTLTFPAGSLTKLSLIEAYAFGRMATSSAGSVVTIGAMPAVTTIESHAFESFVGKLVIDAGDMLALKIIEQGAFQTINNNDVYYGRLGSSRITIGALPLLATLEPEAFANTKLSRLTINAGDMPHFQAWGTKAFWMEDVKRVAVRSEMIYSVTFGEMKVLETIPGYAFDAFPGTVALGSTPALVEILIHAFYKVQFLSFAAGAVPNLEKMAESAFGEMTLATDSTIRMTDLQALALVGAQCFANSAAKLYLQFPVTRETDIATVGRGVWAGVTNKESHIILPGKTYATMTNVEVQLFSGGNGGQTFPGTVAYGTNGQVCNTTHPKEWPNQCGTDSHCRHHCCVPNLSSACLACTSVAHENPGQCYEHLAYVPDEDERGQGETLDGGWDWRDSVLVSQEAVFPDVRALTSGNCTIKRGSACIPRKDIRYMLRWGQLRPTLATATATKKAAEYVGGPPPLTGIYDSNTGHDPSLVNIDRTTGNIAAVPVKTGNYTMWFIGFEAGGSRDPGLDGIAEEYDQVVLATWNFEVVASRQFTIVRSPDSSSRIASGDQFTVPHPSGKHVVEGGTASGVYYVGDTYKIAPLAIDKKATAVSTGTVDDITYRFSAAAPESFYVAPATGVSFGTFEEAKVYTFSLLAVDKGGSPKVLENMTFDVKPRPVFKVGTGGSRVNSAGEEYTDPRTATIIVGESYKFSRLSLVEEGTTVSVGTFDDITYTLDGADGFFVSAQTGDMFGIFDTVGAHSLALYAIDKGRQIDLVENMTFTVQPQPQVRRFALSADAKTSYGVDSAPMWRDVGIDRPDTVGAPGRVQYAVNSTVNIPPLPASMVTPSASVFVNPGNGDYSKITYKRTFAAKDDSGQGSASASASPGLWLVDTETAEMLAQPEKIGTYNVGIVATDGLGNEVIVRQWDFEVLLKDVDNGPEYGPNGGGCQNGGLRTDGPNQFDKQFRCRCLRGYAGKNCQTPVAEKKCKAYQAFVNDDAGVGVCKNFTLAKKDYRATKSSDAAFDDPDTIPGGYYTVGEPYRIAPYEIDEEKTEFTDGGLSAVRYTMDTNTTGFFLNTGNGEMLGEFARFDAAKNTTQAYSVTVVVMDAGGAERTMETITMRVRYPDIEVAAYGPNGQDCGPNGTPEEDDVLFNKQYACACTNTSTFDYVGENCEHEQKGIQASSDLSPAQSGVGLGTVVGSLVGGMFVLLVVAGMVYKRRVHALSMRAHNFEMHLHELLASGEIEVSATDAASNSRIPREIKRSHVTMTSVVGAGAFGEVWKGVLDESSSGGVPGYMVAVKTSKEAKGEGAEELLREALVMAQLTGHPNVVSLVGVVTSGVPLLLLLSLCEQGSLQSCLKEGKCPGQGKMPGTPPSDTSALKMALEIARGMTHLVEGKFVHRDLAARNVLLDSEFVCKIADFGLSRAVAAKDPDDENAQEYYTSRNGAFPVRWTAPEAFETMKFSSTTDIWSYAIVLLEVVTGGRRPYDGMRNEQVVQKVMAGYRAPRPDPGCSLELYAVMLRCWNVVPEERPSFVELVTLLTQLQQNGGAPRGGDSISGADGACLGDKNPSEYLVPGVGIAGGGSQQAAPGGEDLVPGVGIAGGGSQQAAPDGEYLVPGVGIAGGGSQQAAPDGEYLMPDNRAISNVRAANDPGGVGGVAELSFASQGTIAANSHTHDAGAAYSSNQSDEELDC